VADLKVGVMLPSMAKFEQAPWDVGATARHAEDLGMESVWVVDQLVAGTGSPILDSAAALATAAAVTTRVRLGFGVMVLPLRPAAWAAKQVASLQHLSGNRVILGVGAGGDRHQHSWAAAGVPRRERGRRTDAALHVLPSLITGEPAPVDGDPQGPTVQLAPGSPVPEILVGGMSELAIARAARFGDGWVALPAPPAAVARGRARLAELAAERGRAAESVTACVMCVLSGDPAVLDRDTLLRLMSDVDGPYGIPREQISEVLVWGSVGQVGERLAAYAEAGADRVLVDFPTGDWHRQSALLAEAGALLG
jgi:alkanesulfonate monooxygenase SsuD/methylene tetrahydromethanopterin reductase-like flavin-dependent oxidoreductase (luciferase family)